MLLAGPEGAIEGVGILDCGADTGGATVPVVSVFTSAGLGAAALIPLDAIA